MTAGLEWSLRSILNISNATLEDSGLYYCNVTENVGEQEAYDHINITVLGRLSDQGTEPPFECFDIKPCHTVVKYPL